MLSRNGAAEGTQQVRPVQCHLAELGSVNEEHLWRVTRAPHHILTAGPAAERKRMLTQGIRRGDLQSISGNEERAVGRQAGRWRLTTNGAEVLQRKRFQQPCGDPRCGEKTVKATNLPPPRLHWWHARSPLLKFAEAWGKWNFKHLEHGGQKVPRRQLAPNAGAGGLPGCQRSEGKRWDGSVARSKRLEDGRLQQLYSWLCQTPCAVPSPSVARAGSEAARGHLHPEPTQAELWGARVRAGLPPTPAPSTAKSSDKDTRGSSELLGTAAASVAFFPALTKSPIPPENAFQYLWRLSSSWRHTTTSQLFWHRKHRTSSISSKPQLLASYQLLAIHLSPLLCNKPLWEGQCPFWSIRPRARW